MKKRILFIILLLVSLTLGAENFIVESYDVDISVRENYSMHIKEKIKCYFSSPSHGIYRDIQYRFSNPDGNFADPVIAEVSSFTSPSLSSSEKEDGCYRFYLGDEERLVTGPVTYLIEYDYSISRDLYKEYDEFYYNIISPAWDTYIYGAAWSVTFPKEIGDSLITVVEGDEGSTRNAEFSLSDDGRTISGESAGLMNYGGITLRVILPEGYWTGLEEKPVWRNVNYYVSLSVNLLLFLLSVILWYLYGRDRKFNIVKSPLVPDGLSPMEVRYILSDGAGDEKRDLKSMVFYWAEKGYVKISAEGKGKKTDYTFFKLSDISEDSSPSEKALFDIVFKKDKVTLKEIISSSYFGDYHSKVKKAFSSSFSGERRLKEKKSSRIECVMLLLLLFSGIFSGIVSSLEYPGILSLIFPLIYLVIFVISGVSGYFYQTRSASWKKGKKRALLFFWVGSAVILSLLLLLITFRTRLREPAAALSVVISALLIASGTFTASHIEKKTEYGHDITEKALSFREYLTESDKTESALMPYSAALKIDPKDNSEDIPSWFEGNDNIRDYPLFWFTLNRSFDKCYERNSSSLSSSSSSSVQTGGGFSGGGGGSW